MIESKCIKSTRKIKNGEVYRVYETQCKILTDFFSVYDLEANVFVGVYQKSCFNNTQKDNFDNKDQI